MISIFVVAPKRQLNFELIQPNSEVFQKLLKEILCLNHLLLV